MYDKSGELRCLLAPVVTALGYELVGIERLPARHGTLVRIYVDSDSGITLDDCEHVSEQVSGVLDVQDPIRGHYTLEVSSPGFDRPLFTREHYERFSGSVVKMVLVRTVNGRRRITGELRGVDDDHVVIEEAGERYRIPFEMIQQSRLVPQDI